MRTLYLGIDVCKSHLDLANADRDLGRFDNTPTGIAELIRAVQRAAAASDEPAIPVAVLEATGGYEQKPLDQMYDAGVACCRVNPTRVRRFAQSQGVQAKNDRLDARGIARFAAASAPTLRPYVPPAEARRLLGDFGKRRDQVVEDRVRERNRLEKQPPEAIAKRIRAHVEDLEQEEAWLDQRIAELIEDDPELACKADALQQVKGVGPQLARVLLVQVPELGTVSRQKIAALAGVAPYDNDSGRSVGRRSCRGGRTRVKKALYMAAVSAAIHNPVLKQVYQRLVDAGRPRKSAFIAVARKLLVRLNTIAWEVNQQLAAAALDSIQAQILAEETRPAG